MSATITQPAFNYNYTTIVLDHFYWAGTTLPDGTFLQAGYRDSGNVATCNGFDWFVAAFTATGVQVFYDSGSCGLTGTHVFALANTGVSGGLYSWVWKMDSTVIGSTLRSANASFSNVNGGFISEASTTTSFSTDPGLAFVEYNPAIRLRLSNGSWVNTSAATVHRASGGNFYTPCPPYRIAPVATEIVDVGDSLTTACLANGAILW